MNILKDVDNLAKKSKSKLETLTEKDCYIALYGYLAYNLAFSRRERNHAIGTSE